MRSASCRATFARMGNDGAALRFVYGPLEGRIAPHRVGDLVDLRRPSCGVFHRERGRAGRAWHESALAVGIHYRERLSGLARLPLPLLEVLYLFAILRAHAGQPVLPAALVVDQADVGMMWLYATSAGGAAKDAAHAALRDLFTWPVV